MAVTWVVHGFRKVRLWFGIIRTCVAFRDRQSDLHVFRIAFAWLSEK